MFCHCDCHYDCDNETVNILSTTNEQPEQKKGKMKSERRKEIYYSIDTVAISIWQRPECGTSCWPTKMERKKSSINILMAVFPQVVCVRATNNEMITIISESEIQIEKLQNARIE